MRLKSFSTYVRKLFCVLAFALVLCFSLVQASEPVPQLPLPFSATLSGKPSFAVFQGPSRAHGRARFGQAKVRAGESVQVFGTLGDWTMIQYSIDDDDDSMPNQTRIGYVQGAKVNTKRIVPKLQLASEKVSVEPNHGFTDNPLGYPNLVERFEQAKDVTLLATLGDYALVEVLLQEDFDDQNPHKPLEFKPWQLFIATASLWQNGKALVPALGRVQVLRNASVYWDEDADNEYNRFITISQGEELSLLHKGEFFSKVNVDGAIAYINNDSLNFNVK